MNTASLRGKDPCRALFPALIYASLSGIICGPSPWGWFLRPCPSWSVVVVVWWNHRYLRNTGRCAWKEARQREREEEELDRTGEAQRQAATLLPPCACAWPAWWFSNRISPSLSSSLLPLASVSPASAEASSQKRDSRVESTREVGIQSLVCLPTSVVKGTGPGTLCTHSNTQAAPHPPPQSKQAQRARRIFRERSSGGPTTVVVQYYTRHRPCVSGGGGRCRRKEWPKSLWGKLSEAATIIHRQRGESILILSVRA